MRELIAYKADVTIPVYGTIADAQVYLKKDVDEAIAKLKQKLEDVQASMYADVVDANMEIRRLKDKSLDVKNVAHVLKAFKFYLCQLTHCAYDERTAKWIIDNWEQDYKRIEADK